MQQFNKKNKIISQKSSSELFYLCFPELSEHENLCHRVYTRNGGCSSTPYSTLNISHSVNDDHTCVEKNLKLISDNMGAAQTVHMNQQHGDTIISLKKDGPELTDTVFDADALITDIPGTAVMVKQADCQGVILFDPVKSAAAVVHSGWKGSVQNIIGKTVKRMVKDFNCLPENIKAAIGPSLGPCCAEFKTYKEIFPEHFRDYMAGENNFDFWSISQMQMINEGIQKENIEVSGICTKCRTDMFYSFRGEGETGRFATAAMIIK